MALYPTGPGRQVVHIEGNWESDGYLILRQMLGADEVEALGRAFDGLLELARRDPIDFAEDEVRFVVDREPFRLHRVVWCGGADPALAAHGADGRFVNLACDLLGSDTVVQLIQQAHFKLPGDEVSFAWHQDASNRRYGTELWSDVNGQGSFVQVVVAVDAMDADNGALKVMPGSHRLGFVAEPDSGRVDMSLVGDQSPVTLELQPGDAVVFGPFLVHGSPPNRGRRARRVFLQGYASPGANRREYPGCGTGVMRPRSEVKKKSSQP